MKKRILALLLTVLMVTALLPFGASAAGEKLVAITFDDGPSQLLDGLAARGAKATFFMLGQMAESRKSIVKRAWEEGHQVCSHSYDHPNLNTLSADAIRSQFSRTDAILDSALGFDATFMIRPPYGNANKTVLSIGGVPFFYWSVDTEDWKSRNADSVYNEMLRSTRDGSIVLMHDIYPTTITAALRAIDTLKSQGYQFVTVAELYYRRGVALQNGVMHYSCPPTASGTASELATPSIKQSERRTEHHDHGRQPRHDLLHHERRGAEPRQQHKIHRPVHRGRLLHGQGRDRGELEQRALQTRLREGGLHPRRRAGD